ncbi:EamA family transporter [Clostridiaceae bacterium UIB06]|uniref:EamA family transporter n=1 Tax=Clostridium thailandense TaxID=2794346 RepID=A0A949TR13_9CLOT|nr:EamA family transporter [Clostridium thailandense]MCH5137901.1 EamA family transporter [Clostridiaceae bacterium UIB06]
MGLLTCIDGGEVLKKGYIYAIISAIFFGTAGIFVKLAYKTGIDSISLLIIQYIIAVFLMFTIAFLKDRKKLYVSKKELFSMAVLGAVGNTLMTVFYYKAFEHLQVAMVTMLLFTYPIMVFIYSAIFENEKIQFKKMVAIMLAFIGCVFTLNTFSGEVKYSIRGLVFGILSAVFYAFMNLYTEKKLEKADALTINAYSTLFSLITLFFIRSPEFLLGDYIKFESLIYIIILAVLCEIIPLTLLYTAIQDIGALKVSVIGNLEIPTAMIVSFMFLRESISMMQILGAILIVYAVYLIRGQR